MCAVNYLALLYLLFPAVAFSGSFEIEGRVVDANEEPLVGATVLVQETGQGIATDGNGHFRISGLESGTWTLVVRYVGYERRELSVDMPGEDEEALNIVLTPDIVTAEELVVTASILDRITRYQPTQSYDESDILQRNTTSLGTLIDGEPGVAMRSFGQAPARPVIRGMDGERIQVLENGMKMGDISATAHDHAVIMDPQAINQLDIIRGPASLIYGSSAMGGIINAHSNDIPSKWTAGSSGFIGGEGQTGMESFSGFGRYTYGSDSQAFSIRGNLRNTGNMKTPVGEIPGTDLRAGHLASGYAYRNGRSHSGLSVQYSDQRYGIPEDPFDPDEEVVLEMQRLAFSGSVQREYEHPFWQATQFRTTFNRYTHEEIERAFIDGTLADEDLELAVDQDYVQAEMLIQHGSLGILDNGTFGLSLDYYDYEVGGEEALTPDAWSGTLAGFVVEEINLSGDWLFQSGLRLEWDRTGSLANHDFPDAGEVRNHGIWAGALGVNGPLTQDIRLGFQLSRAHRTPSVEELFSDAIHLGAGAYEIGDPDLENEIGYGVDLFMDYESVNREIHIALYANRISGYITMVPTGEYEPVRGLPVLEYRGSNAELLGGEFSYKQKFGERVRFSGQADYIHGSENSGGSRRPLPYMPPLRLTGSLAYDAGTWWTDLNVRHVFAQNRTAEGEASTSGYTLINTAAGLRLGNGNLHHIALTADNLFDVTWRDHLSRIEQRDIPMLGRNIRLSYRYYY